MQAPHNDRWERTKLHLIRNFLVKPGEHINHLPIPTHIILHDTHTSGTVEGDAVDKSHEINTGDNLREIDKDHDNENEMREAQGSGLNVPRHGETEQTSPVLACKTKRSAAKLKYVSSVSTVSVEETSVEEQHNSKSHKRRSNSSNDAASRKKKKDAGTQITADEKRNLENARRIYLRSPLVFRLCRCSDHVCL
ncbi:uncharacterized protein LOC134754703 [Cydia strobilella]|uniref:uncharacterized protein LOC134754703 n=1 Tax=Cydia strobilella TaxID=1100964 RepID=UPI0030063C0E